jgi:hypothetical protein
VTTADEQILFALVSRQANPQKAKVFHANCNQAQASISMRARA